MHNSLDKKLAGSLLGFCVGGVWLRLHHVQAGPKLGKYEVNNSLLSCKLHNIGAPYANHTPKHT